jgi:hypothetical protein
MKIKTLLCATVLIACIATTLSANAASVEVNATNFPDPAFLSYIQTLTSTSVGGTITNPETFTSINCSGQNIKTLTGIEYFTGLTSLNCSNNQLTCINLRGLTKLINIDLSNNNLNSIDIGYIIDTIHVPNIDNNGRTIKVYSYERGSGYTGTAKKGYYVPIYDQSSTTNGLPTLIYNARNSEYDSSDTTNGGFNINHVVENSWAGATIGTINGADVLFLDSTTVGANANLHRFTYKYFSRIGLVGNAGDGPGDGGALAPMYKAQNLNMTIQFSFYLDWAEEQVISAVNEIEDQTVNVYSINGTIHVGGTTDKVVIYNLRGQQMYSGGDCDIAVPAGLYIVKADGAAHKVLVR